MSEKPYSAKRWTDIPQPRVVGKTEFTEEEKKQNDEKLERILKEYGILKENENLKHPNSEPTPKS